MEQDHTRLDVTVNADTSAAQSELRVLEDLAGHLGRKLTSAFEQVALKGRRLSDVLRSIGLSLSKLVVQAALKPLQSGFGSFFRNIFSGIGGAATGAAGAGITVPFAKGGVIASPVGFPLQGGQTGLAGEAGPEAILPLARGSDGRLGVRAPGGVGGGVNVTFNVSTPDAESFTRSETQLAAMLTRVVGRGERNL